jgi:putative ABC transport system permease protein
VVFFFYFQINEQLKMEDSLVATNIRQRPMRTVISVIGVALGVVLIVLVVGLVRGMLKEQGRRSSNVGAELIFRRQGNITVTTTSVLNMPVQYAPRLASISGVKAVSPVGQYLKGSDQGFGMEIIDGIDYESYAKVAELKIREGRPLAGGNEVIIDPVYAKNKKVKVGDQIDLFGRKFNIVGLYEPEIGSRLKIPLSAMQNLAGSIDRCTFIFVKCQNPEAQEQVASSILSELPGNQIIFVRDIPSLYEKGTPVVDIFLKVVIAVAVIISTLVIMLAMYTMITERTREIGILKSLGASNAFIVTTIQKEAFIISALGVLVGFASAYIGRFLIVSYTALLIEIEPRWLFYSGLCGLLSGLLGALYPAMRAAKQDPIKALSYE